MAQPPENDTCPICLDPVGYSDVPINHEYGGKRLFHYYHSTCIIEYINQTTLPIHCAICKKPMTRDEYLYSLSSYSRYHPSIEISVFFDRQRFIPLPFRSNGPSRQIEPVPNSLLTRRRCIVGVIGIIALGVASQIISVATDALMATYTIDIYELTRPNGGSKNSRKRNSRKRYKGGKYTNIQEGLTKINSCIIKKIPVAFIITGDVDKLIIKVPFTTRTF